MPSGTNKILSCDIRLLTLLAISTHKKNKKKEIETSKQNNLNAAWDQSKETYQQLASRKSISATNVSALHLWDPITTTYEHIWLPRWRRFTKQHYRWARFIWNCRKWCTCIDIMYLSCQFMHEPHFKLVPRCT